MSCSNKHTEGRERERERKRVREEKERGRSFVSATGGEGNGL
jgi:hypothetical protein